MISASDSLLQSLQELPICCWLGPIFLSWNMIITQWTGIVTIYFLSNIRDMDAQGHWYKVHKLFAHPFWIIYLWVFVSLKWIHVKDLFKFVLQLVLYTPHKESITYKQTLRFYFGNEHFVKLELHIKSINLLTICFHISD